MARDEEPLGEDARESRALGAEFWRGLLPVLERDAQRSATRLGLTPADADEVRGRMILWALRRGAPRLQCLNADPARSAFLRRVAGRIAYSISRRASSRRTTLETDLRPSSDSSFLNAMADERNLSSRSPAPKESLSEVQCILRQILTPRQWEVLRLRLVEMDSLAEVGRKTGTTRNAARLAHRRAIRRICRFFKGAPKARTADSTGTEKGN